MVRSSLLPVAKGVLGGGLPVLGVYTFGLAGFFVGAAVAAVTLVAGESIGRRLRA
jgi:hypothetical protein